MMSNVNNKFYLSFFIIIIFSAITDYNTQILYIKFDSLSVYKLFFNSYIYLSLFYLPLTNLTNLNNFFENYFKFFFIVFILYGFLIILLSIENFTSLASIFGNPTYGPIFLSPLFLLWGTQKNALFWFNKFCIFSISIGIFIFFLSLIFEFYFSVNLFFPIFYLIIAFNYQSFNNKVLIIFASFVSPYVFLTLNYRFGLMLFSFSVFVLLLTSLKSRLLLFIFKILFLLSPILFILSLIYFEFNFFQFLTSFFSTNSDFSVDTRSILYYEFFNQLSFKEILFGKGVLGAYYSEYFYFYRDIGGDNFLRPTIEVGFLHFILKGGLIYFLIFYIFVSLVVLKKYLSFYFLALSLYLSIFLALTFLENYPYFSIKIIIMWILISFCISKIFNKCTDEQIKNIIANKYYFK